MTSAMTPNDPTPTDPSPALSRPAAIILCGGLSRRMGRPKAWLPFGPEVLLQRIVRLIGEATDQVVVVAAEGQDLPPLPGSVLVARDPAPDRGPLQGIAAGMDALPSDADLVFVSGTDTPFVEPAWIGLLAELIGDADLAIPEVDGFLQPLAALYRRSGVRPSIEGQLSSNRRSPSSLVGVVRSRVVRPEELAAADPSLATLWNLNTPEDYRAALAEAGF
ncbi:molybdenum cofactor guanylyltransferase [Isosphaeraceae bacterium EP7]